MKTIDELRISVIKWVLAADSCGCNECFEQWRIAEAAVKGALEYQSWGQQ